MNKIVYIGGSEAHFFKSHFIEGKFYEYYDGYTNKFDYYIVVYGVYVPKKFLITLEEYREIQINKILNDEL